MYDAKSMFPVKENFGGCKLVDIISMSNADTVFRRWETGGSPMTAVPIHLLNSYH